ncbi:peptidoglycan-binding domain-containing protein [Paracoccus laeviglucosivorans]|uniref:Peptidoglycan binding domain-containing protein n=1 Tax=Paracoccus laeviglucosivorans TaxID=1197861 RepID=A0A521ASX6_9RHOB|nr:peptidoglycan-binding domain-containing protein [Paracoccus laeviglucosivorans]SMO37740.1 hypothetical protein SAMN06265221_101304 [Paracoccus laeviglucosivorans]
MRRFALVLGAGLTLPLSALAEDVVIRIEAKRGSEAVQTAAQGWAAQFPDVVTFPLADGWTGIALGPMPREQATARLDELKRDAKVPGDSFLSPAAGRQIAQVAAGTTVAAAPVVTDPPAAEPAPEIAAVPATPEPAPPPPEFFLRIESSTNRTSAEEMLAKRREILPEAGLWTLPNGRSVVGLGPIPDEATGEAWLRAFKTAGAVPRDAFLSPAEDMGDVAIAGKPPELGAPPAEGAMPLAMPALEDIQRALRWAGHYEGAIDGKDGPMTQAAIADEIVRLRASPDTATAMAELIRRREAWRAEMHLTQLQDAHTGLALPAPMDKLAFDRTERALSIYGPKDGSGAALILFSQPGGQQEMLDLAGLVTALGWVPAPERQVSRGSVVLDGRNETHVGHSEGHVVDGRVQGFVLIWPVQDPDEGRRLASEISDNMARFAPGAMDPTAPAPAPAMPSAVPVN